MSDARPRYKRSLKNYLIDSRFQLKYTSFMLIVSLVVAAPLGMFLFRTSSDLVHQSEKVAQESSKLSEVVKMQVKNDYGDDPDLMKSYGSTTAQSDKEVAAQQQGVVASQLRMRIAVVGGLGLLVVLITLLGIYFTHKVAGPIYKMKLLLGQFGQGKLNFYGGLRKGDELQSFFEAFTSMVASVKGRKQQELEQVEAIIGRLREDGQADALSKLETLRNTMKSALEN
jgi:hypothetical protein